MPTSPSRTTTRASRIVELPAGFFDNIPVADQRLATAQIVLTLTDSRGIGQVQFNLPVPKPSGELTAAGKPLTRKDYLSLLEGTPTPTTVRTTTTSTTRPGPDPPPIGCKASCAADSSLSSVDPTSARARW